jgi:hypothetical protein
MTTTIYVQHSSQGRFWIRGQPRHPCQITRTKTAMVINQSMGGSNSLYTNSYQSNKPWLQGSGKPRKNRVACTHGNQAKETHTVMEHSSSQTVFMLGLSFTGRIHLSEMASRSSIILGDSSEPVMSRSKQSVTRPSLLHI